MRYQLTARFYNEAGVLSVVSETVEAKDPDHATEKAQPRFDAMALEQEADYKIFMIRPAGRADLNAV